MFALTIHTLGLSEKSIILSLALTHFETNKQYSIEELKENTCFIKFDAKEQKLAGRNINKETVKWWNKQCDNVKKISFFPSDNDVFVVEGLDIARKFINTRKKEGDYIFTRGHLSQFCLDDLCRMYDEPVLFNFWDYLDFRTAIIMTKETCTHNGYCEIEGFDKLDLMNNNPVDDNILEILQLIQGK